MAFNVPEKFRVTKGDHATQILDGNNGAFVIPLNNKPYGTHAQCFASDGEIWKPIENYEGLYEVSTLGRVKSLPKEVSFRSQPCIILSQEILNVGGCRVTLQKNGEREKLLVNRLVAAAFIHNIKNYPEVNHINGDRGCNYVTNLEWCTKVYNMHHAVETGLMPGLTIKQIEEVKYLLDCGMTPIEISEKLSFKKSSIVAIRAGNHRDIENIDEPLKYQGPALWQHVSVLIVNISRTGKTHPVHRSPTWAEMQFIRNLFWESNDVVLQFMPQDDTGHCLHLWSKMDTVIVSPPKELYNINPINQQNDQPQTHPLHQGPAEKS